MFGWLFKNKYGALEEKTQEGFNSVKKDMEVVGKWIKHLDIVDKQVFDQINELKLDLASIKSEIASLREGIDLVSDGLKYKQVFDKMPVYAKQTGVDDVVKPVQTAVQTGNFYGILKGLTSNERLLVFTILNSNMKLSYEDIALLLGKERATIRGQINSIKQKSEGLIEEISEKNGKKRVFIPEEIKGKLTKYAKVRVVKNKNVRVNGENGLEDRQKDEK